MDGGVDEEAAAVVLLMVVDVVEELTRVSSRVVERKKNKISAISVGRCRRLVVTILTGLTALSHGGDADTPD